MKLRELTLQNFMQFASETVTFHDTGTSSILGEWAENPSKSNGAGKSSLIEAILYALFGRSRNSSEDEMIKQGTTGDMYVQLKFDFNNQEYVIRRGRSKSTAIISLTINGNPIGGGVRDINAIIIKNLGMTLEVFVATVFFLQSKSDVFSTASPSDRKRYLASILDLGIYDNCTKIAKNMRDQLTIDLDKTQSGIQQLVRMKTEKETSDNHEFTIKKNEEKKIEIEKKKMIAEVIVSETMSAIARFEQELSSSNELISQLAKLKSQYNGKTGNTEKIRRDIESKKIDLKNRWENKNLLAKALPDFEKKKDDINLEISGIVVKSDSEVQITKDKLSQFRQEQGALTSDIRRYKSEIDSAVSLGANCPTCKQNIDQDMVASLKEEKSKKIEEAQLALDGLKGMLETLLEEQRVDDKSKSRLSELKNQLIRAEGEITLSKSAKDERDQITAQGKILIDSLEETYKTSIQEQEEMKVEVDKLQERVNKVSTEESTGLSQLRQVYQIRKTELESFSGEMKRCDEFILRAKHNLEEIQKLRIQIEQDTLQISDKQNQLQAYQQLVDVFSQKGIPAIIIENTIAEVENITNEYLAELGSVYKILIKSQKETKTGDVRETLDIIIEAPEGVRNYNMYSGGEKTIIDLSLRLALSTVLSSRNSVHFDCVFLDEVIASLDEENRENFLKFIKLLSNKFSQIYIISHIAELRDIFDHSLKVVRSFDGSRVVVER